MALPKKQKNPNKGMLPSAVDAKAAKQMADALSDQATRLFKEAEQLRIENNTIGANQVEQEANDLMNEATVKNREYETLKKKAEAQATASAFARFIPNAIGTFVQAKASGIGAKLNPINYFQNQIAAATPFTQGFSQAKNRALGGGFGSDDNGPAGGAFKVIADRIESSNILLKSITRTQVQIIDTEKLTAAIIKAEAEDRKKSNIDNLIYSELGQIKDLLAGGTGPGSGSGGGGSSPSPSTPPRPPAGLGLPSPPQRLLLTGPPRKPGATDPVTEQAKNIARLVTLAEKSNATDEKILDELKEGDAFAGLNAAEGRGVGGSRMGLMRGPNPDSTQQRQGGGIFGAIGGFFQNLMRGLTGFFGRFGPIIAGVGAAVAGIAGFLGLGRGGAATVPRSAVGRAAQAVARGRGLGLTLGGRAVMAAARPIVGRAAALGAARFIPGIGNIVGAGMGGWEAIQQARRGNWGGAAANLGAAGISLINPWAGIAASAGASLIDTSRPGRPGAPPTDGERRLQRLESRSTPTPQPRPAPTVITNNYNNVTQAPPSSTVVAQYHRTVEDRRNFTFAYTV